MKHLKFSKAATYTAMRKLDKCILILLEITSPVVGITLNPGGLL